MRVISICFSDLNGGAARAAYRIHRALLQEEVDARMKVWSKLSDDITVEGPNSTVDKGLATVRPPIGQIIKGNFRTSNPIRHSSAWLPSGWVKSLNSSDADILHLHWVGCETLTIREIGQLRKPVVWTLHDMWAFCGAEHYTDDGPHARWRYGYGANNRPKDESGFDLNRWTWNRKQRHWQKPFHIVCPSHWLAECVKASALMQDWPVSVIPNALDLNSFRPIDQALARQILNLPQEKLLILFGAMGGSSDPRKGGDLLLQALGSLKSQYSKDNTDIELIIFGQSQPRNVPKLGFPIRYIGHLHDNISLALLYSVADIFALPSRQDNFPNTVAEAIACGTPVVAFNIGGIPDLIQHQVSGYLAKPYDPQDLAQGIKWVLEHQQQSAELRIAARHHAKSVMHPLKVASQYLEVYKKALEAQKALKKN